MTPSISVIIPAYNHLSEVLACLTSLQTFASQQVDIQFIVQDDCSPDVFFPAVLPPCSASAARNPVNLGFGGNCNAGAARASGDILFFVNQDVMAIGQDAYGKPLSQSWDIPLLQAFDNPEVGIVGAKLLFPDGRVQNAGGLYDGRCQPFHRGLGWSNHTYFEVNTPEYVSWTTGAALAIRRDLFNHLNGFDTIYERSYWEDVDLCERAKQTGAKVWYEPRCALVHHVGTSGGSPTFAKNAEIFRKRWVDNKCIKTDIHAIKERFW